MTIVYAIGPSNAASSTPVTATVCGIFQLAGVNTSDDAETVPSAVLLVARPMVTLASGATVRTTVNEAAPPSSLVTRPDVGVTETPPGSSSLLLTLTSAAFKPLKAASVLVAAAVTIV